MPGTDSFIHFSGTICADALLQWKQFSVKSRQSWNLLKTMPGRWIVVIWSNKVYVNSPKQYPYEHYLTVRNMLPLGVLFPYPCDLGVLLYVMKNWKFILCECSSSSRVFFWPVGGSSAEAPRGHFGALILYDLGGWGVPQQQSLCATSTNWSKLLLSQHNWYLQPFCALIIRSYIFSPPPETKSNNPLEKTVMRPRVSRKLKILCLFWTSGRDLSIF